MAEKAALLDVDGTLVDANYQHAIAWYRAFREFDITLPIWRIHRAIGMGGDQLVPALLGQEVDEQLPPTQPEGVHHGGQAVKVPGRHLDRRALRGGIPLPVTRANAGHHHTCSIER